MKRIALIFAALLACTSASAQWQTPNHSVPTGRGAGVQGFGNVAAGAAGVPFVGNGASADPSFQTLGYAGGGTNATTQVGARNNMFPTPTRAGDVVTWNGTLWVTLAGNNAGSNCFGENASGVPSWVGCLSAVGGTNGQVQYNNSGALGGFTVGGDATLNTGTGALTLATVNANVGSFGSATQCVAFTTNGKGLITAASAVTCTPAIASVTGLGTGVATAAAIAVNTAGGFVTSPVNSVAGTDQSTAWPTYTATPTCNTGGPGTWTTNTAHSKTEGKTVRWQIDVTLTAAGTCSGSAWKFNLPSTPVSAGGGAGGETAINGTYVVCSNSAGSAVATCTTGSAIVVNERFVASGVYEGP